jgi:hypothetical protein
LAPQEIRGRKIIIKTKRKKGRKKKEKERKGEKERRRERKKEILDENEIEKGTAMSGMGAGEQKHRWMLGPDKILRLSLFLLRRWKLQVLDLRTAHQNFWNVWSGAMAEYWAPQAKSRNQAEEVPPWKGVKQPLRLIVDLNLELDDLDELQIYLFEWVQQRKSSIQLCCRKMQIWGLCTCGSRAWPIHRVLGLLELDCMEEVVVHCPWTLCALGMFAPYLGQMRNLCKLRISQICVSENIDPDNYKQLVATFTSQFSKLGCLRKLCMSSAYFLHGHLHQVLR